MTFYIYYFHERNCDTVCVCEFVVLSTTNCYYCLWDLNYLLNYFYCWLSSMFIWDGNLVKTIKKLHFHHSAGAASRWLTKLRLVNNKINLKKSAMPKIIICANTITLIWYAKENVSPTKIKNIPDLDKNSDIYFHQLTICWTFIV